MGLYFYTSDSRFDNRFCVLDNVFFALMVIPSTEQIIIWVVAGLSHLPTMRHKVRCDRYYPPSLYTDDTAWSKGSDVIYQQ